MKVLFHRWPPQKTCERDIYFLNNGSLSISNDLTTFSEESIADSSHLEENRT